MLAPHGPSRAAPPQGASALVLPTLANVLASRNSETTANLIKRSRYHALEVAWFAATTALGFLALTQPFALKYVPIMVALYLWMGFGVTFYLHRHLTHRSFEMAGWLKPFFAFGSAVGIAGDPVFWVGHHRYHHRFSDSPNDVHSPRHGFWHSHMGWFLREPLDFDAELRKLAPDCRQVWYLRLLEGRLAYAAPHLLVAAAIYAWLGLPGLLYGLYLPMLVLQHHTWAINSLTHLRKLGYRTFETSDDSVNVPLLVGALGEGWHNNHHASAARAPHGLAWYEFDPTKYLIWALERVGLVWKVKWT
jgi:stearoyl-CoA desaturase (delta-9 desaturase)